MVLQPNAENEDNVTPVLSAVAAGSMAFLELLVKLMFCWWCNSVANVGDLVLINCLLKAGADPNKKDENIKIVEPLFLLRTKPETLSPEAKAKGTEAKERGQDTFHIAINAYTQIFNTKTTYKTYVHFVILSYLLLKRSLCWLQLGQVEHALSDAKVCGELKPDWPKECFREGAALRLLQRVEVFSFFYKEAANARRNFHGKDKIKAKS
ncbi:hypothetical protein Bca4012_020779 [Brassica carinata]|uniref:Uncharacterized protein n=1 Tax=Brassica carinata TaxID=52824 RepID=A0A8X8BCS1_BRACI|nr:hypothetical protein Bca52824_000858 [Brassica carinata]